MELREGHGDRSLAYEKWGTKRPPCLGAHRALFGPCMWVPLQFFTFRRVQSEPPAIYQLQLWSSYYRIGSHEGFHFGNGFHFGKL